MIELPIDLVPNMHPLQFRWKQAVDSMVGRCTVHCSGSLPPGVDDAVAALIAITHKMETENAELRGKLAECTAMLNKRSEAATPSQKPPVRTAVK